VASRRSAVLVIRHESPRHFCAVVGSQILSPNPCQIFIFIFILLHIVSVRRHPLACGPLENALSRFSVVEARKLKNQGAWTPRPLLCASNARRTVTNVRESNFASPQRMELSKHISGRSWTHWRRWTGIEPAGRGSPVPTALKAAEPTRYPDISAFDASCRAANSGHPAALSAPNRPEFTLARPARATAPARSHSIEISHAEDTTHTTGGRTDRVPSWP
jgi:hypothetical protein